MFARDRGHKVLAWTSLLLVLVLPYSGAQRRVLSQAPIANDDSGTGFITGKDMAFITADILANDRDPDGDGLRLVHYDDEEYIQGMVDYYAAGHLDSTFGLNGIVVVGNYGDFFVREIAIQPDSKIVIVGSAGSFMGGALALIRYQPNGSLDTSFGSEGCVSDTFTSCECKIFAEGYGLALQPDGKIVVSGRTSDESGFWSVLARYNPNGSLDTTFNGTGFVLSDFSSRQVALQPDGKIIVAGYSSLGRYNADGSLDETFDGDGKLDADLPITEMAVQPDGKIVTVGSLDGDIALSRYLSNGLLDATFGGEGKILTDLGSPDDEGVDLAIYPGGRITVGGSTWLAGTSSEHTVFALARYLADGSLDASFDGDGLVITDLGSAQERVVGVAVQPDGKIVLAGSADDELAIARYDPDGSLDANFESDGVVFSNVGDSFDYLRDMAIQPKRRIILAGGVSHDIFDSDISLAGYYERNAFYYNPNHQFDWLLPGEQAFDSFNYIASDGVLTDTATVTITIYGPMHYYFPIIHR